MYQEKYETEQKQMLEVTVFRLEQKDLLLK